MINRLPTLLTRGCALALLVFSVSSPAKVVLLDRIAAVVNASVIMESELNERVRLVREQLQDQGQPLPPGNILRQQVLERTILETLQLDMAERGGIRISDNELNEALSGIANQNGFTLEEFVTQLQQEGMDWARFREEVRRELTINQLLQRQVSSRIRVTDKEVDQLLASELGKQLFRTEFHLAHILIQVPGDAGAEVLEQKEALASQLVDSLRKGADFAELARNHSQGQFALEGGDLGWRPAAQLPSLFADEAVHMQPGDISNPIRSGNGFHILKMIDRKGDAEHLVQQYRTRHILIKSSAIRTPSQAQALASRLRERILAGESFADLAREFSDDPGSGRNGGDLDWVSNGDMVPAFEEKMLSTPVGDISEPFETRFGWHILQVTDVRTEDMSEEYKRLRARQALHKRRYEEELQLWLRELREEAYVEIRI